MYPAALLKRRIGLAWQERSNPIDDFFTRHYEFMISSAHVALLALIILPLGLHRSTQISLLVAAALVFAWFFHVRGDHEPCGTDASSEGIVRPRPALHS
jgi:hypothetical protein